MRHNNVTSETSYQAEEIRTSVPFESHGLLNPAAQAQAQAQAQSAYPDAFQHKPLMLTSRLRDLWRTPATMLGLYLIAVLIATAHLCIFIYLNNQPTDGPRSIPQNYVATTSHFLGLAFRTFLCASLSIAFTQCLWRLMRIKAIKVSAIDRLFRVVGNPLLLTRISLLKVAPVLFILALFTVIMPIAITFPQGALTVSLTTASSVSNTDVPTYNAAFVGNGTWADARTKAFGQTTIMSSVLIFSTTLPIVSRLGRLALEVGDISSSPSPCGPDCSYSIEFEGPYARCNTTVEYQNITAMDHKWCEYTAFEAVAPNFSGTTPSNFRISLGATAAAYKNESFQQFNVTTCTPSRALYSTMFTYVNNTRFISHTESYIGPLADMLALSHEGWYVKPNDTWNQGQLDLLAGYNHLGVINAFTNAMSGELDMTRAGYFRIAGDSLTQLCGPPGSTVISDTRFNIQRDTLEQVMQPEFIVTQELINEALFNITLSAALQLDFYNDTTQANVTTTYNIYSFATPQQLLIPYLLCLVLSLPFLYLGVRSLRLNGVSAMDGGFTQLIMTTTGSEKLRRAAAAGCLGGEENVPKDLDNMRIRFGEIWGNSNGVATASFGEAREVISLRPGVSYGA